MTIGPVQPNPRNLTHTTEPTQRDQYKQAEAIGPAKSTVVLFREILVLRAYGWNSS